MLRSRSLVVFLSALLTLLGLALAGCPDDVNENPGRLDASTIESSVVDAPVSSPTIVVPAPTNVTAVAADASATITWASSAVGLIEYTVTASPGGATKKTVTTDVLMTGLTNGTSYTFTVMVTTSQGTSAPSAPSNAVTPTAVAAAAPAAPTNVVATAGNTTASLTWTAATANGSAITGYTVTSTPGNLAQQLANGTTLMFTGLTNGTSYTFKVKATNAIGTGPESIASNAVVPNPPPGSPDVPTNVVSTAGNGSASVTWTAPNDNGSAITGSTITSNPGGLTGTVAAGVTTGTVNGLTNGTSYTFVVTSTNANGTSSPSAPSAPVTPIGPPGAPTAVTATRGDTSATVMWTAPANNGGSAITGYTVTSSPGGFTAGAAGTSVMVNGLTNGIAYTFTVTATSAAGTGVASTASNSITPAGVPGAPNGVTATIANTNSTVSWVAANANGSAVTSYTVTSNPGGFTATNTGGTSAIVVGLANGTAYTFTVTATNVAGTGAASLASASITPNACAQTTYNVSAAGMAYAFEGFAGTNPQITLCKGTTYTFHVTASGHPFGLYGVNDVEPRTDVTNNKAENGDVVWAVSMAEPANPFYRCGVHSFMTNTFNLQ